MSRRPLSAVARALLLAVLLIHPEAYATVETVKYTYDSQDQLKQAEYEGGRQDQFVYQGLPQKSTRVQFHSRFPIKQVLIFREWFRQMVRVARKHRARILVAVSAVGMERLLQVSNLETTHAGNPFGSKDRLIVAIEIDFEGGKKQ